MENYHWIFCNSCTIAATASNKMNYVMTNCGQIFCKDCSKRVNKHKCKFDGKNCGARRLDVNDQFKMYTMSVPEELRQTADIIKFQIANVNRLKEIHNQIMRSYIKDMEIIRSCKCCTKLYETSSTKQTIFEDDILLRKPAQAEQGIQQSGKLLISNRTGSSETSNPSTSGEYKNNVNDVEQLLSFGRQYEISMVKQTTSENDASVLNSKQLKNVSEWQKYDRKKCPTVLFNKVPSSETCSQLTSNDHKISTDDNAVFKRPYTPDRSRREISLSKEKYKKKDLPFTTSVQSEQMVQMQREQQNIPFVAQNQVRSSGTCIQSTSGECRSDLNKKVFESITTKVCKQYEISLEKKISSGDVSLQSKRVPIQQQCNRRNYFNMTTSGGHSSETCNQSSSKRHQIIVGDEMFKVPKSADRQYEISSAKQTAFKVNVQVTKPTSSNKIAERLQNDPRSKRNMNTGQVYNQSTMNYQQPNMNNSVSKKLDVPESNICGLHDTWLTKQTTSMSNVPELEPVQLIHESRRWQQQQLQRHYRENRTAVTDDTLSSAVCDSYTLEEHGNRSRNS